MSPLPLVVAALLAGSSEPPRPPEVRKEAALAACREALRLGLREPQRTALRHLLARRLAEQERFDELLQLYREDTRERPGDGEVWRRLGAALLFLRSDPGGALPALEEAVKLRAEDADAHVLLGVCLNGLGRHPEAVAAFEEAVRLDPEAFELRPAAKAAFEAAQRGERWP